jgi:putative transposase
MDVFGRRIVGWSIAPHIRTELVLDALGMAVVRRTPMERETILHSDHGSQYTSWAFGQRIERAGLLGSMGSVGDCYDNAMMESFWGTLQLEVLDRNKWANRAELANAIFEWIECWYNPTRRDSNLGMLSPLTTKNSTPHQITAVDPKPRVSGDGGKLNDRRLQDRTVATLGRAATATRWKSRALE